MERIKLKLIIAYDGTGYAGWQVQKTGIGVQQKIEEAFGKLFPDPVRLHSSSRTDTGVHALGMVAHVEIPKAQWKMVPAKLRLALNAFLPEDIRVMEVSRCRAAFHARFDAVGKEYRYFIWNRPAMNPLWRLRAWHVPRRLDVAAMERAANHLVGQHDFRSFAANRAYEIEDTVRTVTRCKLRRSGAIWVVVIRGDGFLYKMCRSMVGTLVQVGLGKFAPDIVKEMLEQKDRRAAGMSAPAHGLVLWRVFYSEASFRK